MPDDRTIRVAGMFALLSSAHVDAKAHATGKAFPSGTTAVGAGISLNVATVVTDAGFRGTARATTAITAPVLCNGLKTTVYMTDITQRKVPDAVRKEYFGERPPASTILQVTALTAPGIEIEIEAIAAVPGG